MDRLTQTLIFSEDSMSKGKKIEYRYFFDDYRLHFQTWIGSQKSGWEITNRWSLPIAAMKTLTKNLQTEMNPL